MRTRVTWDSITQSRSTSSWLTSCATTPSFGVLGTSLFQLPNGLTMLDLGLSSDLLHILDTGGPAGLLQPEVYPGLALPLQLLAGGVSQEYL